MDTNEADRELKDYYRRRAPVYDDVYTYPERQDDLRFLEQYVSRQFDGNDVIEIAAGTGYWTQFVSQRARTILAMDITQEALAQIKGRHITCPIQTRVSDAYALDDIEEGFDGAFAGLWFSHIPLKRQREWLQMLHSRLDPGSTVLLLDNSAAQCEQWPVTSTDEDGNTFQERTTNSGERFSVLKNFPGEAELVELIAGLGHDHQFRQLDHFWLFQYVTNHNLAVTG